MELSFESIKQYYDSGLWDETRLLKAVERSRITNEQFEEITGRSVYEITDFESAKERKQNENKKALSKFLHENPIQWTDGQFYGVTEEDQNELALNLNQYQLQVAAGIPDPKLEWHPRHSVCREFTLEEYTALILTVKNFVYPYVQHCQEIKEQIYTAETIDDLKGVEIVYEKHD